ncbi:MAG: hypothetical protein J6S67_17575 [Methanobrevibacter sp.]|nr:hypothetical protein [Methanobrevibacter sp.]
MTDFIIIGNANGAITKNVFPLFKDGKVRFGYSKRGMDFNSPDGLKNINAVWFVTFPVVRKPLILTKKYDPDKYPKYDNYDAIEVSKVKDIPYDYEGVMGVPITFLDRWCDGFEIDGVLYGEFTEIDGEYIKGHRPVLNSKNLFNRLLIRKK